MEIKLPPPHDLFFMEQAMQLAQTAAGFGEIPVGAVVVCRGRIIGKGMNYTVRLNDPTAHAEMIAITAACEYLGSRYLTDCTLYVTLEPCVMCAGALFWAMPSRIVYGASDDKRGCSRIGTPLFHPKSRVEKGLLADECSQILQDFFRKLR